MGDLTRRAFGNTGLEVSVLGFGAMELRGQADGGPPVGDADAGRLLNTVLDEGINFIDTSIDYGRSEELIGRHISHRRSEYVLASKCGCVPGARIGSEHVHTAENIREGIEQSLRKLKTDHLDLVQFHRSLTHTQFEADGALQEALAMRDEGKVRFVGVSGLLPNVEEHVRAGAFDALQVPYSILQRDYDGVITRAAEAGLGVVVRGGAARGVPEDWTSRSYYMVTNNAMRGIWEAAALDDLLDGMSRVEFTLRFTLSHPGLHTAIVGTANPEHVRSNAAAAARGALPDDVLAEVFRRLEAADPRASPAGQVRIPPPSGRMRQGGSRTGASGMPTD